MRGIAAETRQALSLISLDNSLRYWMKQRLVDTLEDNSADLQQTVSILKFNIGHERRGERITNINVYYLTTIYLYDYN